ncbi:MAG: GNAT family N-acetyltransferase [Planctomycetota bacterium]|jgi:ribosomal-protein-alanine N-acetyltransferase
MEAEDIFADLPTLQAKRLTLRKMTLGDAEDVFKYSSDPEVFKFVGGKVHKAVRDSEGFLKEICEKYERRETIVWGIVCKERGKLIGDCGFIKWDASQARAELDYLLSREYWNQGLMTEAIVEVIRFGFEKMQLSRIQGICEIANVASARVMEKAGMRFEGVLRSYIQHNGKALDMKMYSIIGNEGIAK